MGSSAGHHALRPAGVDETAAGFVDAFHGATAPSERTIADLEHALGVRGEPPDGLTVRLLGCLARADQFRCPARAFERADRALALARRLDDPELVMDALHSSTLASWSYDHLDRLDALGRELEVLASRHRRPDQLANGLLAQLWVATARGATCRAASLELRLVDVAAWSAHPVQSAYCRLIRLQAVLAAGDVEQAAALLPGVWEVAIASGHDFVIQSALGVAVVVAWARGELATTASDVRPRAERDPYMRAWAGIMLIIEQDELAGDRLAARLAELVGPDLCELPRHMMWIGQLVVFAEVARTCRDATRGRQLGEMLSPYRDLVGTVGFGISFGSVALGVALAAEAAREHHNALDEYATAVEHNDIAGTRLWAAFAATRRAELAVRTGHNDAERMLTDARTRVLALGIRPLQRDLQRLSREPATAPLSAREREVIAELAVGRTNKQIAAVLYISVKTVERHLANTYVKLGVSSRVEAAAWAFSHGVATAA